MPDARGNFKGVALNGRAGEAWDRIFGTGGLEEQQVRYRPTGEAGAFRAALEAEVAGWREQVRRDDERMARGHYGDPAPEGAGSQQD